MEIHPYANLFPMQTDAEIQSLAADIKQHGLRQPIVIDDDDKILDGRNRAAACVIANVTPVYEPFSGSDAEKLPYVVSVNVHRRHLTTAQRSDIAAAIANMQVGQNQHSAKQEKEGGSNELPSKTVSTKQAAKLMNVSVASVKRAKAKSKPKPKATDKEPTSTASIVLDVLDRPIPAAMREANALAFDLLSYGREMDNIRKRATELSEQPGGEWVQMQLIDQAVRMLKSYFHGARYHTACHRCDGTDEKCQTCNGAGFLPDYLKATVSASANEKTPPASC